MLRLRVFLLLTGLGKCFGVGLFLLTMEVFFGEIFESVRVLDFFLLTREVFFWEMFESVHWDVICSLKRKEIR